jgi:hypothetical protein
MNTVTDRFKSAPWLEEITKTEVLILGAGGTGSWTSLLLNRAGVSKVFIQDFDKLEEHNLGGQFYNYQQTGKLKVEALEENILAFTNNKNTEIISEKFDENSMIHEFVFSCFDNMLARKIAFEKWVEHVKENNIEHGVFIDLRLIMESATIFCVKNNDEDIENYKKNLFSDEEVPDAPCTLKQTSHAAAYIASVAVSIFLNHLTNKKMKSRNVPFMYETHLALLLNEQS